MRSVTDQTGRRVVLPERPERIVSLVPSQTELLFDLGLDREIVGVTKFCVHPSERVRERRRIGGTKKLRLEAIAELEPDLIIGNKEENEREQILGLADRWPTWLSDVETLGGALEMIRAVGEIVGCAGAGRDLAGRIETALAPLAERGPRLRVAYLIWQRPLMVAAGRTFIGAMLEQCNLVNVFAHSRRGRYPEVRASELRGARPDAILLSSEPFPFRETHRAAFAQEFPGSSVHLVDGEMFSWYGSRMLLAADYLRCLLGELESGRDERNP